MFLLGTIVKNLTVYNAVYSTYVVVVQPLSCVWFFATPLTSVCQASLSFTVSQSLLKLMSIELMMLSNHFILCHSLPPYPQICLTRSSRPEISTIFERTLKLNFPIVELLSCVWFFSPGFPVLHCLPEFAQIHVHWVGDAIQPSHPLSLPSSLALNHSQHQSLFQWVSSGDQSIGLSASASVLPMNTQGSAQAPFTGSAES